MNKLIVSFFLLHLMCIPQYSALSDKNLKGNLFHKVNVDLLNTINTIFTLLQLNKNFTSEPKNWQLLSMHATFKSAAEMNYMTFKDLKRASKLSKKRKPKKGLFNLDKIIDILIQEKLTPGHNNIAMFTGQTDPRGINLQPTSLEIPQNSEESFAFLKEYLNNLDETRSFDFPLQKIKGEFEKNKAREKRKLKLWKAPNITEENIMNHTNHRRVFQGRHINIRRYPFLASIHVMGKFVCAGSIISKVMVITAATCLQIVFYNKKVLNKNINDVAVRVGSDHPDTHGEICRVSQIYFHPFYDPIKLSYNLAILRVEKALQFRNDAKIIRRIEYTRLDGNLHSSVKEVVIVGWGDKNDDISNINETLSYSHLDIFYLKKCADIYTRKYVSEKNFCAGYTHKGSGACQRDIGGPAIVNSMLVGVVSFGPPVCGTPNAPTVFTNLGYHIEWIDSVMRGMQRKILSSDATPSEKLRGHPNLLSMIKFKSKLENLRFPWTMDKKSNLIKPVLIPRSQYPKAIQVLTYLLNELISAGQSLGEKELGTSNENEYEHQANEKLSSKSNSQIIRLGNMADAGNEGNSIYDAQSNKLSEEVIQDNQISPENATSDTQYIIEEIIDQMSSYASNRILRLPSSGIDNIDTALNGLKGYFGLNNTENKHKPVTEPASKKAKETTDDTLIRAQKWQSLDRYYDPMTGTNANGGIYDLSIKKNLKVSGKSQGNRIVKNTPSVIFENTDDDLYEDVDQNTASSNYETDDDVGLSIEITSGEENSITLTKTRPNILYTMMYNTGPDFKKDEIMEFVVKQKSTKVRESSTTPMQSMKHYEEKFRFPQPPKSLWQRSKNGPLSFNEQRNQILKILGLQNIGKAELVKRAVHHRKLTGYTTTPSAAFAAVPKRKKFLDSLLNANDPSGIENDYETENENSRRLLDYINIT